MYTALDREAMFVVQAPGRDWCLLWFHFVDMLFVYQPDAVNEEIQINMSSVDISIQGNRLRPIFDRFKDQTINVVGLDGSPTTNAPFIRTINVTRK